MGLLGAAHGLGRLIVIAVSVPLLLVGLFLAGAAVADDGGVVLGGTDSGDAQVDDLLFGVGFGGVLLLIGGTGLYRGLTGNLTGSRNNPTSDAYDAIASGDADALEDAIESGFDGDGGGGGFGGFDGDGGGDGGGGGGGGGE